MSHPSNSAAQADAAVIDVGSNSVRLVMYRLDGRAIWTVFNEKVLAGLGRDLSTTGRLSPDGMATALMALARFQALIGANRPAKVYAAATAAVRDARDGMDFCRRVEAETGLRLKVLTGAEEANGAPGAGVTLPLGPFAFESPRTIETVHAAVARELRSIRGSFSARTFNAVGGAWRNLALLHMRLADYPLGIIHQYELGRSDALEAARFIEQQSRGSLERIDGISRRRVDTLPHAAAVLEGLVEGLGLQRVVLSAYGLREGLLIESMNRQTRAEDPLVAGCAALGGRPQAAEVLGVALDGWLQAPFARLEPMFGGRDAALLAAACRLADFGAQLHPDHRADLVFEQVLRAPIAGADHAERVFLACAAFGRHTGSTITPSPHIVGRLLSPERYQRARAMGAAVRLGCDLSGRGPDLLARARLEFKSDAVVLQSDPGWEATLLGDPIAKRAQTLAGLLDRQLKIRRPQARPLTLARGAAG